MPVSFQKKRPLMICKKFLPMLLTLFLAGAPALNSGCTDDDPLQNTEEPTPDPDPEKPDPKPEEPDNPDEPEQPDETLTRITFKELDTAFPNPERGFYYPYAYHFDNGDIPAALTVGALNVNRMVNRTLVLTEYFLRDYIDKPIADEALALIRTNMEALRAGGSKCVLRFAYCDSDAETAKPWDAEEEVVMQHIAQLKPIFQEYGDVIYVLQAGFVGVWGEWYYTDHFNYQPSTTEDFQPRRRVMDALLDAMPSNRTVAMRTPQALMMCFGLTGADSITRATAHDGSIRSRIAGHNDCFLASGNDVGTFTNKAEREMWMNDTQYIPMGGETCGVSSFCSCANSLSDMEKYHWSYLNISYHQGVIKGWRDNECFDEIEQRLGYRLVLSDGEFTKEVKSGEPFKAVVRLENKGFASPLNPRGAELVFVSDQTGTPVHTVALTDDPRFWLGGQSHTLTAEFAAPALQAGESYTLCLNLPDGAETLRSNPLFSIRTANTDTWDSTLGMNRLYTFTAR